ncbi:MAG TPA: Ig-like domain-containing protein, partial [Sphingopyxis sp.]|nr:Ig-like domain-containing protein [Sphingopyxis sp.]
MDAFENRAKSSLGEIQPTHAGQTEDHQAVATSSFLSASASAAAASAAAAVSRATMHMLVPDARGRITLPDGVTINDIQVRGNDLVITLPNGEVMVIPNGAVNIPAIEIGQETIPASTVAQLLEGTEQLNPEAGIRSSGGNFAEDEGNIQAGFSLGDLLPYTELAFPEPREEDIIPVERENRVPEVIIITPNNPAGAIDATDDVSEAGLPARNGEAAGTDSESDSEFTSGSINYSSPDGVGSIKIGGETITAVGQEIHGQHGILTITAIEPGRITYRYELLDNTNANDDDSEHFTVVITDIDGDSATATLTINVVDDAPVARDDSATAQEDTPVTIDVFDNDTSGADSVDLVTGVALGDAPTKGSVVY